MVAWSTPEASMLLNGVSPRHCHGFVSSNGRCHQRLQLGFDVTVFDDNHFPALTIAAAWRESGMVQNTVQRVLRDRFVGKAPGREGGCHDVISFHGSPW